MSKSREFKVLVLDEDDCFADSLRYAGQDEGLTVDRRASLLELGSVGKLRGYDALIVDPAIRPVNGLEIADYVDKLVPGLPVLLASDGELPLSGERWPRSIVGQVAKDEPVEEVLAFLRCGYTGEARSQAV